jgi:putative intracellular protease/amidase
MRSDTSPQDCPPPDMPCIPRGNGVRDLIAGQEALAFLRHRGAYARYIGAVCAGTPEPFDAIPARERAALKQR